MNFFSLLFGKKEKTLHTSVSAQRYNPKGLKILDQANQLFYVEKKAEDALPLYDEAVRERIIDAYCHRAFCLQNLKYHFEAIEDFDKAIQFDGRNANFYFSRGNSRKAVGDFNGEIDDFRKAIELSKIKSEINRINDLGAKQQNFASATALYQANLDFALSFRDMVNDSETIREVYLEKLQTNRRTR
jgi:tetratricopeptide (TPR) repeat protein